MSAVSVSLSRFAVNYVTVTAVPLSDNKELVKVSLHVDENSHYIYIVTMAPLSCSPVVLIPLKSELFQPYEAAVQL